MYEDTKELPGISRERGLRYVLDNEELYRGNLIIFMLTKRGVADEIRKELAAGSIEKAARIAHSMKSVAGTIGAEELSDSAAALEIGIDTEEEHGEGPLLTDFEHRLQTVIAGLDAAFGDGK